MEELKGQAALVTGASRGFGAGIAESLRQAGAEVWITGRDEVALRGVAERIGSHPVVADVTSSDDWDRLFEQLLETAGQLDILVNNAGTGVKVAPFHDQSDDDIRKSIEVNLVGAMMGCRRAASLMSEQRSGTIVNVSSLCARQAWPDWAVYSAAKAGLVQFGKCLYAELRPHRVRVTTVIPSWGATDFCKSSGQGLMDPQTTARCIQPNEMGDLITFLCQIPPHLAIQDVTLLPMEQEIVPL